MKNKIIKAILATLCFTGIILAGAENADGSCDLAWSLSWLAVVLASGLGLKKMEDAR